MLTRKLVPSLILWTATLVATVLADATAPVHPTVLVPAQSAPGARTNQVLDGIDDRTIYGAKGGASIDTAAYSADAYREALVAAIADACASIQAQIPDGASEVLIWQAAEIEGRPMVLPQGRIEVKVQVRGERLLSLAAKPPVIRELAFAPGLDSVASIAEPSEPATVTERNDLDVNEKKTYTGIVVDATGLGFSPAMAPRIVTEKGRLLLDPSQADWQLTEALGLVSYAPTVRDALADPRVGGTPLVIQGLNTGKTDGEIVVPEAMLSRALRNPELIRCFLAGRVVIVAEK